MLSLSDYSSTDPRHATTSPARGNAPARTSSPSRRDLMAAAAERRAREGAPAIDGAPRPASPRPPAPAAATPSPALPGTSGAAAAAPAAVRRWPAALRCALDGEPIAPGAAALDAHGRFIDAFRAVLRLAQTPAHMAQLAAQHRTCSEANAVLTWLVSHPASDPQALREAAAELFVCPITHVLPNDPVAASDGYTYERGAIERWLQQSSLSPMNRTPLAPELRPNVGALALIDELDLRGAVAAAADDASPYASAPSSPSARPDSPLTSLVAPSAPPLPAALARAAADDQNDLLLPDSPHRSTSPLAMSDHGSDVYGRYDLAERLAGWCARLEDGTQLNCGVYSIALPERAFAQHPAARKLVAGTLGVITADDLGMLRVWTPEGLLRSSRSSKHLGRITHLALSPDQKFVVTVGRVDEKVKQWRWDATAGQLLPVSTAHLTDILPPLSMAISALAVRDDVIAVGGCLGELGLIERGAKKTTAQIPAYGRHSGGPGALAFLGDRLLGGGGTMNKVKVWQVPTLARIGSQPGPGGRVTAIAVQPGGPAGDARVLYGDSRGVVQLEQQGSPGPNSDCIAALGKPVRALFWAFDHAYCLSDAGLSLLARTDPHANAAGSFEVVLVDPDAQEVAVAGEAAFCLSKGGRISRLAIGVE